MKIKPGYRLFTPEQRGHILWLLKKGPALGDREALADYTQSAYKLVTGRDLTADCDNIMNKWRKNQRGKCGPNQTYLY